MQKITPFLWFDNQAEDVVNYSLPVLTNSIRQLKGRASAALPGAAGA